MRALPTLLILLSAAPAAAQTGAAAFERGCGGGCHGSETRVLRAIPRGSDDVRRRWITDFMARHPIHSDAIRPDVIDYLTERSRR